MTLDMPLCQCSVGTKYIMHLISLQGIPPGLSILNDFLRIRWTNGILYILYRLNCNDLSTREMCSMTYRVPDIMNDSSLMKLYIYQMFSLFHWGRANLGCETSCVSSLVSNGLRSNRFSNAGLSFCELNTATWFKIDSIYILTKFIPFQRVAKWLLNWNMVIKKFLL